MTFLDSYQEWPRSTPGRAMVVGLGAGALGGAVVGFSSLFGGEGFSLSGAVVLGGSFGGLVGLVAGGLAGVVAGGVAGLLARTGQVPARVALALICGVLMSLTAWFTWNAQTSTEQVVVSIVVGATAAGTAWAWGPWCLVPTRQGPEARNR